VGGALLAAFGGFASFNLLLSAAPMYAARGGGGPVAAGAVTGALTAATVAVQPLTPRLLARAGERVSLQAAGLLLGLPCLAALPAAASAPAAVAALAALRGLGFGVFVVAGVALTAGLFPPDRRGRAIGVYGAVSGAAGILGTPLGLTLAHHGAYRADFLLAAAAAALVPLAALALPGRPARPAAATAGVPGPQRRSGPGHAPASARTPARARAPRLRARLGPLAGPLWVEAASTTAYGVLFTFLPLTADAAPTALLAAQAASVGARLGSGRLADRIGPAALLTPAAAVAALGACAGAAPHRAVPVTAGAALFGAGFGAVQNASLLLVMRRAGETAAGLRLAGVSRNLAFDAGTGLGALGGGPLLAAGGPATLFPATGALLAASLAALLPGRPAPGTPRTPQPP
jgi:predicted MFS family arabinose efflux permease